MQHIEQPKLGVADILEDCNANVEAKLARNFSDESAWFVRTERGYIRRGAAGEWNRFTRTLTAPAKVNAKQMEAVYVRRMVPETASGRAHYVKLRDAGKQKLCSYCFARTAEELDHYLPKKTWPQLCFMPINLVPTCGKCNKRKSEIFAGDRAKQPIHPYLEDLDSDGWLTAVIKEGNPIPFFKFERHDRDPVLSSRVKWQAKKLFLAELYHERAGILYQEMELRLFDEFGKGLVGSSVRYDPDRVSAFMNDEASRSFALLTRNHWKVQCLKAWRDDEWFLEEGCQPSESRAIELAVRGRTIGMDSF